MPKILIMLFAFAVTPAQAAIVDFTNTDWDVGKNVVNEFTFDGIRLSSVGGNLTFNDPDGARGCGKGNGSQIQLAALTGLACIGDGIPFMVDRLRNLSYTPGPPKTNMGIRNSFFS